MMVMIMSNELATSSKDGDDYDGTRSSGDDNDRVDAETDSSDD